MSSLLLIRRRGTAKRHTGEASSKGIDYHTKHSRSWWDLNPDHLPCKRCEKVSLGYKPVGDSYSWRIQFLFSFDFLHVAPLSFTKGTLGPSISSLKTNNLLHIGPIHFVKLINCIEIHNFTRCTLIELTVLKLLIPFFLLIVYPTFCEII